MKIREGAYYRTRGGNVFGPMARTSLKETNYVWRMGGDTSPYSWTDEGYWRRPGYSDQFDLIAEVYVSDTPPSDEPAPETKTLRDEFAGYAIIGLLAAGDCHAFNRKEMAAEAYRQADAMMEARRK